MNEIKKYISKIVEGNDLTEDEAQRSFQIIMKGGATPAQIAAFLIGLRMKGESIDEIAAAAKVMRVKAEKFKAPSGSLDTCGTGGDSSGSFNISTAVAFVVAGCGVPVAKHGNKAISSKSGSADVLSMVGVNIDADKHVMEKALREANICFMMAPKFHTAMKHVAPIRMELGVRTIFNILGPLSNPANASFQLLGVYSEKLVEPIARVLKKLGLERAWVVHGSDGMDEITTTGKTFVAELKGGRVRKFEIEPSDFGIKKAKSDDLKGGEPNVNAQHLKHLLMNKGKEAYRDIVLLNSAAALVVAGVAKNIEDGIVKASESIESGAANDALMKLCAITNS
ncbi:MAG: anthranilate phosphoribosyltransferase [Rickettsiales bacterium]|nr:anthranilate phosphoribosyltransferase [Pseudomonadota bacterium]MDA0966280.1 anthranilate phosphoribosyltransferase [Pseudomonadota bacterium]MDG4543055.1 anthranilate phosphoribosyltransferase [Rickettsiales bacterium]MDG4545253.1 anthranilate phosphoribosyltransferase [Rickettsiales bacterium]MDG4547702.1 anthranilate phosphoribosyltransferase [Rickettsiales bacterium]